MIPSGGTYFGGDGKGRAGVLGLRGRIEPVLAEGRETLAFARDRLDTLVTVAMAVLLVSLATLAAVLCRG
jgi:hypothetical protein